CWQPWRDLRDLIAGSCSCVEDTPGSAVPIRLGRRSTVTCEAALPSSVWRKKRPRHPRPEGQVTGSAWCFQRSGSPSSKSMPPESRCSQRIRSRAGSSDSVAWSGTAETAGVVDRAMVAPCRAVGGLAVDPPALVEPVRALRPQRCFVVAPVVVAEVQLTDGSAGRARGAQGGADVGLGTAAVAAVLGVQDPDLAGLAQLPLAADGHDGGK